MIQKLLRNRAIKSAFDRVQANDVAGLQKALAKGIDANATRFYDGTDIEESLLLRAVDHHSHECVGILLEEGADPNIFNQTGLSPFLSALSALPTMIKQKGLSFTADLGYEAHPDLAMAVDMFNHGGDRHYRPPGFVERIVLDCAGPDPVAARVEANIDEWLVVQSARMNQARLRMNTQQAADQNHRSPRL